MLVVAVGVCRGGDCRRQHFAVDVRGGGGRHQPLGWSTGHGPGQRGSGCGHHPSIDGSGGLRRCIDGLRTWVLET